MFGVLVKLLTVLKSVVSSAYDIKVKALLASEKVIYVNDKK